jgi:hypothetical protein
VILQREFGKTMYKLNHVSSYPTSHMGLVHSPAGFAISEREFQIDLKKKIC